MMTLFKTDADDAGNNEQNSTDSNREEHLEIHESDERHCAEDKDESEDSKQNFVQHDNYSFMSDLLWKYLKCCYC